MMAGEMMVAVRAWMVLAVMSGGMMFATVMTPSVVLTAVMSGGMMTAAMVAPAVVSPTMPATAASQHGTGQQQSGQGGQAPANAENPRF
jgi:hypothetical protein